MEWTQQEVNNFIKGLVLHGDDYTKIAFDNIPSRSPLEVKEYATVMWFNKFKTSNGSGRWTKEEDEALIRCREVLGSNKFKLISNCIPTRTYEQICSRAQWLDRRRNDISVTTTGKAIETTTRKRKHDNSDDDSDDDQPLALVAKKQRGEMGKPEAQPTRLTTPNSNSCYGQSTKSNKQTSPNNAVIQRNNNDNNNKNNATASESTLFENYISAGEAVKIRRRKVSTQQSRKESPPKSEERRRNSASTNILRDNGKSTSQKKKKMNKTSTSVAGPGVSSDDSSSSSQEEEPTEELLAALNEPQPSSGTWSLNQELLFHYGLKRYGKGNMRQIEALVPNRDKKQCISHAQKRLHRLDVGDDIWKILRDHKQRLQLLLARANTEDSSSEEESDIEGEEEEEEGEGDKLDDPTEKLLAELNEPQPSHGRWSLNQDVLFHYALKKTETSVALGKYSRWSLKRWEEIQRLVPNRDATQCCTRGKVVIPRQEAGEDVWKILRDNKQRLTLLLARANTDDSSSEEESDTEGEEEEEEEEDQLEDPTEKLLAELNEPQPSSGTWSLNQELLFHYGLKKYGKGNMRQIEALVPNRDKKQCISHAQKRLHRLDVGDDIWKILRDHKQRLQLLLARANTEDSSSKEESDTEGEEEEEEEGEGDQLDDPTEKLLAELNEPQPSHGRWSLNQDILFHYALKKTETSVALGKYSKYSLKRWEEIQAMVPNRNAKQCFARGNAVIPRKEAGEDVWKILRDNQQLLHVLLARANIEDCCDVESDAEGAATKGDSSRNGGDVFTESPPEEVLNDDDGINNNSSNGPPEMDDAAKDEMLSKCFDIPELKEAKELLSDYNRLVLQHVELYRAKQKDVRKKGKGLSLHQLGLRCRLCGAAGEKMKYSQTFPGRVEIMKLNFSIIASKHLLGTETGTPGCPHISQSAKNAIRAAQKRTKNHDKESKGPGIVSFFQKLVPLCDILQTTNSGMMLKADIDSTSTPSKETGKSVSDSLVEEAEGKEEANTNDNINNPVIPPDAARDGDVTCLPVNVLNDDDGIDNNTGVDLPEMDDAAKDEMLSKCFDMPELKEAKELLSDYNRQLLQHVELCRAKQKDVSGNGRVSLHQLGLRCRLCGAAGEKMKYSQTFPGRVEIMKLNFYIVASKHLLGTEKGTPGCPHISREAKNAIKEAHERTKKHGKEGQGTGIVSFFQKLVPLCDILQTTNSGLILKADAGANPKLVLPRTSPQPAPGKTALGNHAKDRSKPSTTKRDTKAAAASPSQDSNQDQDENDAVMTEAERADPHDDDEEKQPTEDLLAELNEPEPKGGRWSLNQDILLHYALKKTESQVALNKYSRCSKGRWKEIEALVPNRTANQCIGRCATVLQRQEAGEDVWKILRDNQQRLKLLLARENINDSSKEESDLLSEVEGKNHAEASGSLGTSSVRLTEQDQMVVNNEHSEQGTQAGSNKTMTGDETKDRTKPESTTNKSTKAAPVSPSQDSNQDQDEEVVAMANQEKSSPRDGVTPSATAEDKFASPSQEADQLQDEDDAFVSNEGSASPKDQLMQLTTTSNETKVPSRGRDRDHDDDDIVMEDAEQAFPTKDDLIMEETNETSTAAKDGSSKPAQHEEENNKRLPAAEPLPTKSWSLLFMELSYYKDQQGHANPTKGHLSDWLENERKLFAQGNHPSPLQIQLLIALGSTGFEEEEEEKD